MESELRHLEYLYEKMRDERDEEYRRAEKLKDELRVVKARLAEFERRADRAYDAYISNPEK